MSARSLGAELVALVAGIPPDVLSNILSTPSAGDPATDDYHILIDLCKAVHNVGGDIEYCLLICQQVYGGGVREYFGMPWSINLKEI